MGLFHRKQTTSIVPVEEEPTRKGFSFTLPKQKSALAPEGVWTNVDCDPTPKSQQTWGPITWWTFWLAAVADPASFQTGASLVPAGLSVADSVGVVILANVAISVVIVLNGVIGSRLRIPFPVAARASFGYYFAYVPIISRLVLALFWFGIECYNGGSAVTQMLRAMWPSYLNIPNHLPASAGFTTLDMCSFTIYNIIQLPFFFINPARLRYFFAFKCIYVPAVALATMGSLVRQAGGGGPLLSQGSATGTAYASAWCLGFAALCGNWATLAINSPDLTRYSTSTKSQWQQIPGLLVASILMAVTGIISASASVTVYGGDPLWSPFDIMANWDNRAAVWFCSFGWVIGSIGSNVTANSIAAANDMMSLFPKYINLTRGQLIAAVVGGYAMAPWKVLANGIAFLDFMAAYSVIMGPFAAIVTCDYWLVKKCNYDVPGLYNPNGEYRYASGINWRALVTAVVTIAPTLPGLIETVNPAIQVGNVFWWYAPGFFVGYIPALVVYYFLNLAFPHQPTLFLDGVTLNHPELSDQTSQEDEKEV